VEAISRLLDGLRQRAELAENAEITLEANPGSSDNQKLAGYVAAGVNRFSIGVQSFSDDALARLGRIHDCRTAESALLAAAHSGCASFNVDLMHGLPEQDAGAGLQDLAMALSLHPPHLSWYQLTIERNTPFYRAPPALPAEESLLELETRGVALLEKAGFERYEVSAWARPGQRCRHNLNYWEFGDYLAIGAGAHGKLSDAGGDILRYHKTRGPSDYLGPQGLSRRGERQLDADDRLGEFMLNALRLREGFTPALFEARTDLDFEAVATRLPALLDQGLMEWQGENLRCTALGWRFLDDVVGRFFSG
jgi:putative oxygen-independent coproporphyrinogen III oxidase